MIKFTIQLLFITLLVLGSFHAYAAEKSTGCIVPEETSAVLQQLSTSQDFAKARSLLIKEARQNPRCSLAWLNLGNLFYLMGSFEQAEKAYRRGSQYQSTITPLLKYYLAKTLFRQENLIDSLLTYSEIPLGRLPKSLAKEVKKELNYVYAKNLHEALKDLAAKNFEQAERRIIASLNIRQNAYLYSTLAVALHQQSKWDRERTSLQYGNEIIKSEEEDLILSRIEKALFKRTLPSTNWHLIMDVASGYESNVLRVAQANTNSHKNSEFFKALIDFERFFTTFEKVRSFLNFGVTHNQYLQLSTENYSTAYLAYRNLLSVTDWKYELSPQISYESYAGKPYWLRPGLNAEVSRVWDKTSAGVFIGYQQNINQSEEFNYIDGSSTSLNTYLNRNITDELFVSLSYSLFKHDTGDDETSSYRVPLAYLSHAPMIKLSYRLTPYWSLKTSYEYQQRQYTKNILPEDNPREDKVTNFSLQSNFTLSEGMVLYIKGSWQKSESTMGENSPLDANWDSQTYLAGMGWSVF